ncbi:MAG: RsbRD N-terminal domain-containing protein [Candidatus Latescibacterota bacterium]
MLRDLLQQNKDSIIERWLEDTLATYSKDMSSFLNREKDRFANPVGHALRTGTRAIFINLLDDKMDPDLICSHLNDIIKIRAIQDFPPARAVSFVFLLKKAVRAGLGNNATNPRLAPGLNEIDTKIDQIALFAFDIYTKCREQMHELRVNEVKRSVSALMDRFTEADSSDGTPRETPDNRASCQGGGQ